MLKLGDPFEMDDLFVGVFYDAEKEALKRKDEGFREFHQPIKKLYRVISAVWKKSRETAVVFLNRVNASGYVQSKAPVHQSFELPPKPDSSGKGWRFSRPRQVSATSNENAAYGFLPLTEEEKKRFVESLDEEGKRILAQLEGKREGWKTKRSRRSVAQVVNPDPVATDKETTPTFDKGMQHPSYSDDLWNAPGYRVHWLH